MEDQISNKTTFKYKLELFYTSEKIGSLTFFAEYISETFCQSIYIFLYILGITNKTTSFLLFYFRKQTKKWYLKNNAASNTM